MFLLKFHENGRLVRVVATSRGEYERCRGVRKRRRTDNIVSVSKYLSNCARTSFRVFSSSRKASIALETMDVYTVVRSFSTLVGYVEYHGECMGLEYGVLVLPFRRDQRSYEPLLWWDDHGVSARSFERPRVEGNGISPLLLVDSDRLPEPLQSDLSPWSFMVSNDQTRMTLAAYGLRHWWPVPKWRWSHVSSRDIPRVSEELTCVRLRGGRGRGSGWPGGA